MHPLRSLRSAHVDPPSLLRPSCQVPSTSSYLRVSRLLHATENSSLHIAEDRDPHRSITCWKKRPASASVLCRIRRMYPISGKLPSVFPHCNPLIRFFGDASICVQRRHFPLRSRVNQPQDASPPPHDLGLPHRTPR